MNAEDNTRSNSFYMYIVFTENYNTLLDFLDSFYTVEWMMYYHACTFSSD